jgi:hypothetical protein
VDEVIRNLDDKKCPGPDAIDGAIVKRLHKSSPTFWISSSTGLLPKRMETGKGHSHSQIAQDQTPHCQGYRGISLLSIPGKCLEKLVTERLNYFLESARQTRPQQYGFTAGKSTADAIKSILEFVRHSRKLVQKFCLLTLNIAGAFDNAWYPVILASLWKLKFP